MKRGIFLFLTLALLVACAAGCDPFETELIVNDDGSGKLVQKAHISPLAHDFLRRYGGLRLQGFRPILSEEAAADWRELNPQAGVRLLSYSCAAGDDGSLRVRYEVIFVDIKDLAASVWGWPLQLGAQAEGEALRLRIADPASFMARRLAEAHLGGELAAADQPGLRDLLARLGKGMKTRTTVRLPAPVLRAQGGALNAEKTLLTIESPFGLGPAEEGGAAAVVSLPAAAVRFGAFASPESIAPGELVIAQNPVEPKESDGLVIKLQSASVTEARSMSFGGEEREPRARKQSSLNLNLMLYGAESLKIFNTQMLEQDKQPVHMVSAALADTGADLRSADMNIHLNVHQHYGRRARTNPLGSVSINFGVPPAEAKALKSLEGYVVVMAVAEEDTLEIRPLKAHLQKDIAAPGMTLRFEAITGNQVKVSITIPGARRNLDPNQLFQFYRADGREIMRGGWGGGGGGNNRYTYDMHLQSPMPDDGYVVIQCPIRIKQIKVPFSFQDVPLP